MAVFNKFNQYVQDVKEQVHNLTTDSLKIMLTNVAPIATNTIRGNLTEIANGNGYTTGGTALTSVTSSQTAGVYTLDAADVVFTGSGPGMAQFRYAVLYNDTPIGPVDPLIGWWDNVSAVDLATGETFTVQFAGTGILTLE